MFKYNPEGQKKYSPTTNNFLRNVTKEQLFTLSTDKSAEYKIRILPPWSTEGAYAKGTLVHYRLGADGSGTFVCPNTVESGSCLFCNAVFSMRSEYEKYKVDIQEASAKRRYYSNILNMSAVSTGVLVFPYGIKLFKWFDKYQTSGEFGDITDLKEGRTLSISRTVEGKSITDIVIAHPKFTDIEDYVSEEQLHNLDNILPEPDYDLMEKSFSNHPWKVFKSMNGFSKTNTPIVDDEVVKPKAPSFEAAVASAVEEHKPVSSLKSSLAELEAKLKARAQ